jgi:methyl-accepting chemotaxis protein
MFKSIRNQITLFSVMATLFIAAMGAIGLYSVRILLAAQTETTTSALALRYLLQGDMLHDNMRGDVLAARLGLATTNPVAIKEAAKAQADEAKEMLANFAELNKLDLDAGSKKQAADLLPLGKRYTDAGATIIGNMLSAAPDIEKQFTDFMVVFREMEVAQATLREREEAEVKVVQAEAEAAARTATYMVVLGTLMLAAIAAFAAFRLTRGITRPLANMQAVVEQINEGAMDARVKSERKDELGLFANAFDKLLDERIAQLNANSDENDKLNNSVISILQSVHQLSQRDLTARAPVTQDIIGTVSDSINMLTDETAKVLHGVSRIAGQVATASGKVQTQSALVSKTAEDERISVGQMIVSLTDATLTMNQVSALAEQTNVSAAQATQATDTALETVNATVKGMESIRETIAETEKRIKRLGERSQEISGIVNLINTISERTHVLALNASMQAAVAGEAGRGFAVVAEEVQRLAESSRNATQQIGTLVSNIQLETNETISTVNRTIGQVVQGSEQAQKAGAQMRHTQEITGQLVAQVRRIGEASEQQKLMSANLLSAMQLIGVSNERTAGQITAQNTETESLLDSARRLVESVNVFKLPLAA